MKIRVTIAATAILLLFGATLPITAQDSTPQIIKLQGFLSDKSGGTPVPANGTFSITFNLYDADVGGIPVSSVGPPSVDVTDGFYEVDLPFPASAFDGDQRFLEIIVEVETLSPRVHLASAPFAYVADLLDGFEGAELEESTEIVTAIATHGSLPDAHGDHASLEESAEIDSDIATHAGAPDPHTMYVKKAGDTMPGTLTLSPTAGNALVTTSGNVGIGTTNPSGTLHLFSSTGSPVLRIESTNPVPISRRPEITFMQLGNDQWGIINEMDGFRIQDYTTTGGAWTMLSSVTDSKNLALAPSSGNVGIGTTSPGQRLDVAGKMEIGNDTAAATPGAIRWTGTDFEGFDGTGWVSFTSVVSSQAVYMDDFIGPLSAVWSTTIGGSGSVFQATNYLGFTRVNTGSTTGSSARLSGPIPSGANLTGVNGTAELTFRLAGIGIVGFDLNATIEAGLMVGTTLVGGFRYTAGATASTWSAVSRGTGETVDVVTTGVAPYTTLFQIFKVRVVGGSPTVEFYVNGTLVASQTLGGIGNLGPNGSAFYISNSAAESKGVIADYFRWTHTR